MGLAVMRQECAILFADRCVLYYARHVLDRCLWMATVNLPVDGNSEPTTIGDNQRRKRKQISQQISANVCSVVTSTVKSAFGPPMSVCTQPGCTPWTVRYKKEEAKDMIRSSMPRPSPSNTAAWVQFGLLGVVWSLLTAAATRMP